VSETKAEKRPLLIGCGIFSKEIAFLKEKNGWPLDTLFLDSALHVDFNALASSLKKALEENKGRDRVVFYGACHPRMDTMLSEESVFRTVGQNCVSMLLGEEVFSRELSNGAFFLLEEWARRWEHIVSKTFGGKMEVAREVFQNETRYLLCVRTPLSGDFSADAEKAGILVGLPIRWMDASLDHLEEALQKKLPWLRTEK